MTPLRRYRLLCPIARALDVLGDRWTLLILRDLHAGPARFLELQQGLGIATNLLSTRLVELAESGMIEPLEHSGYRLTDKGRSSDRVLWELARFGAAIERDDDPREPGNLRTIALPLRMLLESVSDRPNLRVRLSVDDSDLTIITSTEGVEVKWGCTLEGVDVLAGTSYQAFLDVGEGLLPFDVFVEKHLKVQAGAADAQQFIALLGAALAADPRMG